jgi:hypothetical protein
VILLKTLEEVIEELEWKYAELALQPAWIDYIRNEVAIKQKEKMYKGMGERVKSKMEILRNRNE